MAETARGVFSEGHLEKLAESPAVELKFIHSAGPGGQNVNKVATAVTLRYDLGQSPLTESQLGRLRLLAGNRISREDILIITARTHRTQGLNRTEALTRLAELLARAQMPPPRPRKATRPTKRAVERRLEAKKHQAGRKVARRAVRGDND
ncbi:aminoacyl-tRNA hydrolase [Deltaproteobacteria bacterium Smac51]|nr:aminoacyl-tRNA hydrolase [Deltaproteobacteria bacterium Smac51]